MNARDLDKYRHRLLNPMPLIGGWLRQRALRALQLDGSPAAITVLEETAAGCADASLRAQILETLRYGAAQGNSEAQEALCRLFLNHNLPQAKEIAIAAGYGPRVTALRALFYFLAEQWDKYDALDFDRGLLRTAYEVADPALRARIADKSRQAGRLEWVEVVSGGRQGRRLGEMNEDEWETSLALLGEGTRWQELWRLAQAAPPCWSVKFFKRLQHAGWRPRDDEIQGFQELTDLAEKWAGSDIDPNSLIRCTATLTEHRNAVVRLAVSPDGKLLASGSRDNQVKLWSLPEGRPLASLTGHRADVTCLAFSPDGKLLASGSKDALVRIWNPTEGRIVQELKRHRADITCLAFSHDGNMLATAGGDGDNTVMLWRPSSGRLLHWLQAPKQDGSRNYVFTLAFAPDNSSLIAGTSVGFLRAWRFPIDEPVEIVETVLGHNADVTSLAVSPDGRWLASGSRDRTVRLWNLPQLQKEQTLRKHGDWITCLTFAEDDMLISGSIDRTLQFWSVPEGKALKKLTGHREGILCMVFRPDGRRLWSAGKDNSICLWNYPAGELLQTLKGHTDDVVCLAVSPDGGVLASGSEDHSVRLWMSELLRLSRTPVARTTLQDLSWVEDAVNDRDITENDRRKIRFIAALLRWRWRRDIQLEESSHRIPAGEFDIEIEG